MPELACILVGDHLGQVKKVLLEKNEVLTLPGCAEATRLNPVISIEPIGRDNKQLIANKDGQLYIYDPVRDETKSLDSGDENLIKALPIDSKKILLFYDKHVMFSDNGGEFARHKKGEVKNAKVNLDDNKLAIVGKDIPLRLYDIDKKIKLFEADPPEKDWLGIQPETFVSAVDFVGQTRIVTCSKSDSVIRVYDPKAKTKPVISANLDQQAFNEHAEAGRFICISATSQDGHAVVIGSNVGQLMALDLRFNVKQVPKKKLQPRTHKLVGSFKGSRGASMKDIKIIPASSLITKKSNDVSEYTTTDESKSFKVISCCLDRYLRIHDFNKNSRHLDRHIYMKTKPHTCSPVFFQDTV